MSGRGVGSGPAKLWENPTYFLPDSYSQHTDGGGEESRGKGAGGVRRGGGSVDKRNSGGRKDKEKIMEEGKQRLARRKIIIPLLSNLFSFFSPLLTVFTSFPIFL